jgi:hypothetical protein
MGAAIGDQAIRAAATSRRAQRSTLGHEPTSALAEPMAGRSARTLRTLLHLQRAVGNQAVGRLLGATVQRGGPGAGAPQAVAPPAAGNKPTMPSIAAHASGLAGGSSFGDHAAIYLALRKGSPAQPIMAYLFIDLIHDTAEGARKGAVKFRVVPMKTAWPGPDTSTTWAITNAQAEAALARARYFEAHAGEFTYSKLGIGPKRYNCALFVEKILKAAGVNRSAGLIASTPLEVARGKKFPRSRKHVTPAAPAAPAAPMTPPAYDL